MTNKGIVKEVNGEMLTVEFERHEACGDCHACMHGSTDCAKHTVKLRGKANVGDRVVVEMDDSQVMAASATACMTCASGWKSGVPIERLMTSTPRAASSRFFSSSWLKILDSVSSPS